MRVFTVLMLVSFVAAAPTDIQSGKRDVIVIDEEFYPIELVKYKSDHDIVNLLVPVNSLNFDENDSSETNSKEDDSDVILFFVEADIADDRKRTYQGLYVLKNNVAKKLLDNGRDAAASSGDSRLVFFGASDGLYVYKEDTNTAEKYGTVTDSIINLAKEKSGDAIYILTESKDVYKVTENGNNKKKIEEIPKAQQIVLDYSNNLYFYSEDKQPYVLTGEGIKKIDGLPKNPSSVNLIRPPILLDDGVVFEVDNIAYILYANGTSEPSGFEFKTNNKPSAYGMEAALIQYYAHDKKIYEYNLLVIILGTLLEELKNFLSDKVDMIQSLAGQTRSCIRSTC